MYMVSTDTMEHLGFPAYPDTRYLDSSTTVVKYFLNIYIGEFRSIHGHIYNFNLNNSYVK